MRVAITVLISAEASLLPIHMRGPVAGMSEIVHSSLRQSRTKTKGKEGVRRPFVLALFTEVVWIKILRVGVNGLITAHRRPIPCESDLPVDELQTNKDTDALL